MTATPQRHAGRRRRGKRFEPARCRDCHTPILWLNLWGSWRKFDPKQVIPHAHHGAAAYPVEGKTAWPLSRLVSELMGRREIGTAEAMDEAYAFPWYAIHVCRKEPTR